MLEVQPVEKRVPDLPERLFELRQREPNLSVPDPSR